MNTAYVHTTTPYLTGRTQWALTCPACAQYNFSSEEEATQFGKRCGFVVVRNLSKDRKTRQQHLDARYADLMN